MRFVFEPAGMARNNTAQFPVGQCGKVKSHKCLHAIKAARLEAPVNRVKTAHRHLVMPSLGQPTALIIIAHSL